ncbi:MAG: hypothetical protein WAM70_07735 [Pyrinomonadaceae bacterium]
MKQTEDQLKDFIIYEAVSGISALTPPNIEKIQIPSLIHCHHFEKAVEKRDRLMERYNQKVSAQKEKVAALEGEIDHLTREIKKRTDGSFLGDVMGRTLTGTKPGIFDNAEERAKKAAKYNAILEVVRRLEDQRERAVDRRNDAVEKHNEALEEANEKLEELTTEALLVIDDDMVAVMDKTSKVGLKLGGGNIGEDLLAAVEICFLQLKLGLILEDHIEGNTQRRDFKERLADVTKLLADLCASSQVRNYATDLFKRNFDLIAKNRQLHSDVLQTINSVDSESLEKPAQELRGLFKKQINTDFEYKHLIDPCELDGMVIQIKKAIVDLNDHDARVRSTVEIAQAPSQRGVSAHQTVLVMLGEMKSNQAGMANEILHDTHFAFEMLNETVIDDFYHRDLRPAVMALREHVRQTVGMKEFDILEAADDDRHFIKRTEVAIKRADLMRLKAELDKVESYLRNVAGLIAGAEKDINQIGDVPRDQAESFRAKVFTNYILCCLPWAGIGFALGLLSRIKSFDAAFRSTNEIYLQLGRGILEKNATMKTFSLILAAATGLGGIILFFALGTSDGFAWKIALPGAASALYLGTTAVFGSVEKQIKEYQSQSGAVSSEIDGVAIADLGSNDEAREVWSPE